MPQTPPAPCLLAEIDQRQDEVLHRLGDLNRRVESLIKACLNERAAEKEDGDDDQADEESIAAAA